MNIAIKNQAAYTVDQFRAVHGGMSRTTFYDLLKHGKGPRIFKVGRRTMISAQSAADWVTRMESESNPIESGFAIIDVAN